MIVARTGGICAGSNHTPPTGSGGVDGASQRYCSGRIQRSRSLRQRVVRLAGIVHD